VAQEPPPVPSSATEPQGLLAEPDLLTRVALFADRNSVKATSQTAFTWTTAT
jgi:hypothetical protein